MYKTIMIPVDLSRKERLDKALQTAAGLSKGFGAALHLVGVTSSAPSAAAHSPDEFTEKLEVFAREQSELRGVAFHAKAVTMQDPRIDLDAALDRAASDLKADLVVMASHVPGFAEHIFASNAGYLAAHSGVSVFVVR